MGCIKIGNGRVYIKSDCTVRRGCNCYALELGGILHLQGADDQYRLVFCRDCVSSNT